MVSGAGGPASSWGAPGAPSSWGVSEQSRLYWRQAGSRAVTLRRWARDRRAHAVLMRARTLEMREAARTMLGDPMGPVIDMAGASTPWTGPSVMVEQAAWVLMGRLGCSPEEALGVLRERGARDNRTLEHVARDVLADHETKRAPGSAEPGRPDQEPGTGPER